MFCDETLSYLVEASCGAVFTAWCEVSELYVQEIHQLDHGFHCERDVACLKVTLGLLCQLSRYNRSCLSSFNLQEKNIE